MVNFRECVLERFRGELRNFVEATGGLIDGFARGIVNGEAQMEARAAGGGGFGAKDYPQVKEQGITTLDTSSRPRCSTINWAPHNWMRHVSKLQMSRLY